MSLIRWRDHIEIAVLALLLYGLGAAVFSRITPAQQEEIELQAGLQQLCLMEQAHYELAGRYFDPNSASAGLEWPWMDGYTWDYRETDTSFWLVVRADLDGNGREGAWGVDSQWGTVRQLMED
jgi:hypothetical protein